MKMTQETSEFFNPCAFWLAKQLRHTALCARGNMHLPDNPSFTKQEQAHPWGTAVLPRRWRTCPESTQTGFSSSGRAHQSPPSPPGLQQQAASCSVGPRTRRHKARCKARFVGSHRLLDRIPGRAACGSACVWARPLGRGGQAGRPGRGRVAEPAEGRQRKADWGSTSRGKASVSGWKRQHPRGTQVSDTGARRAGMLPTQRGGRENPGLEVRSQEPHQTLTPRN